jgi:hypothetical protein
LSISEAVRRFESGLTAFFAARALPARVLGPVDFSQGLHRRMAAACFALRSGDQPDDFRAGAVFGGFCMKKRRTLFLFCQVLNKMWKYRCTRKAALDRFADNVINKVIF